MVKQSNKKSAPVAADTQVAPEAPVTTQTEAKAKPVRYAPKSVLENPNAKITWVKPQAKGPNGKSKSADRYNRFYREGVTVAELEAEYKAANLTRMLARADVRWDVEHNNITLEQPQAAE
jgi:hypothetical protein